MIAQTVNDASRCIQIDKFYVTYSDPPADAIVCRGAHLHVIRPVSRTVLVQAKNSNCKDSKYPRYFTDKEIRNCCKISWPNNITTY
jgi:hypothetical protein